MCVCVCVLLLLLLLLLLLWQTQWPKRRRRHGQVMSRSSHTAGTGSLPYTASSDSQERWRVHTHTHTHTHILARTHTHAHKHTHAQAHTHTNTRAHTHTHTHYCEPATTLKTNRKRRKNTLLSGPFIVNGYFHEQGPYVHACLTVTCHLHFGVRVSAESWLRRRKFSRRSCRKELNPIPISHESGALTTELFPLPIIHT